MRKSKIDFEIPDGLIEHLDETYPNKLPSRAVLEQGSIDREIFEKIGERNVVDYLRHIKKRQEE